MCADGCADACEHRLERDVEDRILSLAGGVEPRTLSDWLHAIGREGLSLASWDAPGFTGGMRAGVVLVPCKANDAECMRIVAHELGEYISRRRSHGVGRHMERRFSWDTEDGGDPLDDAPAREGRKVKTSKPPEKVLPRRV